MQPRIGIPVPTSGDHEYNGRSLPQYLAAVKLAGGEAVVVPFDLAPVALSQALGECHGFVLPGSPADVDPSLYGQDRQEETARPDATRFECDQLILEHACLAGKPLLAICYGLQSLNVWRGGTLIQDLPPVPVNHAAGSNVAVAHTVQVAQESLLAGLLTAQEAPAEDEFRRLPVNSSHHQSVASPGDGLAIVARSTQDGVIEALEGAIDRSWMLGVQWHPERSIHISAASRALFHWLTAAAEDAYAGAE